ncbi:LexA family transcriptional regulator [Sphingomonas sp. KR1UV-12]|uniref:LexA family transcriptional regulator n=1 Tax=Sphingomonas aurea TaxID=3063994 RepID=A0ABT9EHW0_9SPHN|nr:LexA family transcriptional regulator [Sphingomonas sp. KR1UV-12]MDP1026371.1 LexA family transcriptional regulator [Sphingomonas sp. KR1UV-12]
MVTHDELLQALRAWIAEGRGRPVDIARELGLPSSRVSEMLNGRRKIQQREMPILARMLGLDASPTSNVRKIKRIGQVPAGELRQALAETTDSVEVSSELPSGVFALEVDGESMNLVAPFGADVIVDPNDKHLFAGDFYVLSDRQGAFTFKLFAQDPARLVPLSDDPAHAVITLGAEPIDIVGRVVSVQLGAGTLRRLGRQITER